MEFHHGEGYATARNARLEFKGVPIFYAPWFTFPIDDRRKSGLLYPSVSTQTRTAKLPAVFSVSTGAGRTTAAAITLSTRCR